MVVDKKYQIVRRVRKLTGKPAFPTGADCGCKPRRIHSVYVDGLPSCAAESTAFRIHSDLLLRDVAIAARIALASGGVKRAEKTTLLASCVPSFGRPADFFFINVYKNC